MGRRRRAEGASRWRQTPATVGDDDHPPVTLDHDNHNTPTNDESDDDSMELDDDGGVPLGTVDDQSGGVDISSADDSVVEYLQNITPESRSFSWCLPVTPVFGFNSVQSLNFSHPIAKSYHKSAQLIWRHWKCDAEACIPEETRRHTPYSLALLLKLRHMASHTKGRFDIAQSILLEAWRARTQALSEFDSGASSFVETVTNLPDCETKIHENVFGLTLDDVATARRSKLARNRYNAALNEEEVFAMRRAKLQAKKQAKAARRQAEQPTKIAKRQARQQAKIEFQQRGDQQRKNPQQSELSDVRSEIAERVVARRRSARNGNRPAADQIRFEDELVGIELEGPANIINSDLHQELLFSLPSRKDRSNDHMMRQLLNNVHMNSKDRPKSKTVNRLLGGGFSRTTNQQRSLPSERVDLSSMDALYSSATPTSKDQLARLAQLSLSDSPTAGID